MQVRISLVWNIHYKQGLLKSFSSSGKIIVNFTLSFLFRCLPKVGGQRCDSCEYDHWGINSGSGCSRCDCDPMGSSHSDCDDVTGQCVCKPGVGGPRCDNCLLGYWGISYSGCQKCSPCTRPGHVCDPDTGRCVCPRLTEGGKCERCVLGTWNYDSYRGCQRCKCNPKGSVGGQCDEKTGHCRCLDGFEGEHCDRCKPGYYNFPNCQACNCHPAGTDPDACKYVFII